MTSATERLHEVIAAYNDAWNAHDVERIRALHAPDMVFENHTAGERAQGELDAHTCPLWLSGIADLPACEDDHRSCASLTYW